MRLVKDIVVSFIISISHTQLRVLLPLSSTPSNAYSKFLDLLHALVELSELEEELDGLALELQDSLELAATRAVLKGVLQESCNWVRA